MAALAVLVAVAVAAVHRAVLLHHRGKVMRVEPETTKLLAVGAAARVRWAKANLVIQMRLVETAGMACLIL